MGRGVGISEDHRGRPAGDQGHYQGRRKMFDEAEVFALDDERDVLRYPYKTDTWEVPSQFRRESLAGT